MTNATDPARIAAFEPLTGRALLFDILAWARPHDSECEKMFNRYYLDCIPGMQTDGIGNRYIRIGESRIMWSCHVDTVAREGGRQRLDFDAESGLVGLLDGKPGQCLGADDGAGLWMMLEMIRAEKPGLYVFHRGEERGCIGSGYAAKNTDEFFVDIDAAIAFDRRGYTDVITHQSYGRTCSDKFADSFAAQLNLNNPNFKYEKDDTGLFTDTNEYASLIAECTNVAVGYEGAHGPRETLDVYHLEALLDAVLRLDESKLVIDRDPSEVDASYGWGRGWSYSSSGYGSSYGYTRKRKSVLDEMVEMVEDNPVEVARLLRIMGYDAWDLTTALYQLENSDPDGDGNVVEGDFRPIMDR